MDDARESHYDAGRPVIVIGPGHLGRCPECGHPIVEISQAVRRSTARCARGHGFSGPRLIYRIDALALSIPPERP